MYTYRATVLRVIDGDTIECEIDLGFHIQLTRRVRLAKINAPEMNSKDTQERIAAFQATDFLRKNIEGKVIAIKTELDKSDKYGRILGYIFGDKDEQLFPWVSSFNARMIKEGYAVEYKR